MQDMGIKQCECWVIDGDLELSREQVDELNIRLNKNTGAWDWEILANDWDVNLLCEWGFKPDDFEDVLPKGKKKQVIFEFTQDEDLDSFVSEFNKAFYHLNDSDKFKMKVKK
jgi:hypothetical protein